MTLSLLLSALAAPPTFTDEGLVLYREGPNAMVWDPQTGEPVEEGPRHRVVRGYVLEPRWLAPRGEHKDCRFDAEVVRADAEHVLLHVDDTLQLRQFRGRSCRTRTLQTWTLPFGTYDLGWADWRGERAVAHLEHQLWLLRPDARPHTVRAPGVSEPGLLAPGSDLVVLTGSGRVVDMAQPKRSVRLRRESSVSTMHAPWGHLAVLSGPTPRLWDWTTGELLLSFPRNSMAVLDPEREHVWVTEPDRPYEVTPWRIQSGRPGASVALCHPDEGMRVLRVREQGELVGVCGSENTLRLVQRVPGQAARERASVAGEDLAASRLHVSANDVAALGVADFGPGPHRLWMVDLRTGKERFVSSLPGPATVHGWLGDVLEVSGQWDNRVRRVQGLDGKVRASDLVMASWECVATPRAAEGWMCDRGEWMDANGIPYDAPVEGRVLAASDDAMLVKVRADHGYGFEVRDRQAPYTLRHTLPLDR